MIITPIQHGLDLARHFGPARTPGVHMSDLYNSLYAATTPKRYAKKNDEPPPLERWAVGMALEEILEIGFANRLVHASKDGKFAEEIIRPGELETRCVIGCPREDLILPLGFGCWCGGRILYSPDLFIFNGVSRLGEIKLNSMSAKGVPWKLGETYTALDPKFDKYFTQMKCYCFHAGTPLARLYSFSVREMVFFNEDKIFRGWDITFTQDELDREWAWVLHHARQEKMLKSYKEAA